jgi:hypothetical protein
MSVERRGLAAQQVWANTEGRGELIKAPIKLQDLRRRLYVTAKAARPHNPCREVCPLGPMARETSQKFV